METIDTLVLGGGGMKCVSYLGCIQCLMKHKILEPSLSNIKKIYCVSGGMIYILPLLLGYSIEFTIELFIGIDNSTFLSEENISFSNLFEHYGFFPQTFYDRCLDHICLGKKKCKDITLQELYETSNIELIAHTVNISKQINCYISHKTHPNLSLVTLLKMTTAIPFVFQSVFYQGDHYLDGGLITSIPPEPFESPKTIGMCTQNKGKCKIDSFMDFVKAVYMASYTKCREFYRIGWLHTDNPNLIKISTCVSCMDLHIGKEEKKQVIQEGFNQTIPWVSNYKQSCNSLHLTPSLLNKPSSKKLVFDRWEAIVLRRIFRAYFRGDSL